MLRYNLIVIIEECKMMNSVVVTTGLKKEVVLAILLFSNEYYICRGVDGGLQKKKWE